MSTRPMPSSFDDEEDFYKTSAFQKVVRKLKREPLIPLGCLLTVAAFTNAYLAMRRGDHNQVQRMFRARVLAQGFTVLTIVAGGMYFSTERHKERELWKVQQKVKEEEKKQKWLRELEARDEEDREIKEMMERRKKKAVQKDGQEKGASIVEDSKISGEKESSSWVGKLSGGWPDEKRPSEAAKK